MAFNGIGQPDAGEGSKASETIPICDDPDFAYDPDAALDTATDALLASASSHGYYWLDDGGSETNATLAVRVSQETMAVQLPPPPSFHPLPPPPLPHLMSSSC